MIFKTIEGFYVISNLEEDSVRLGKDIKQANKYFYYIQGTIKRHYSVPTL